jgi:hypothetical protein
VAGHRRRSIKNLPQAQVFFSRVLVVAEEQRVRDVRVLIVDTQSDKRPTNRGERLAALWGAEKREVGLEMIAVWSAGKTVR